MITQEYIDRIYGQLTKMDVQLDADPIEFGPSRLNKKVSEVRGHLSSTEKVFMEVSHNLQKIKRSLLVKQTEYNLEQTQLIANDPHVRSGRSQKEREALASTRLVHIQTKINDLTLSTHDLEDLITVIKAKRADLKDLQGRLRDQLKLCLEQIALGQRWGTKTMTISSFDSPTVSPRETSSSQEISSSQEMSELLKTSSENPVKTLPSTQNTLVNVDDISLEQIAQDTGDVDLDSLFSEWGG